MEKKKCFFAVDLGDHLGIEALRVLTNRILARDGLRDAIRRRANARLTVGGASPRDADSRN